MNSSKTSKVRSWQTAAVVAPLLLAFVSVDWLDRSSPICLFRILFGTECWGCGMTRALASVIQGQFESAWTYNKLVVFVFPLCALLLWLDALNMLLKDIRWRKRIFFGVGRASLGEDVKLQAGEL